MFAERFEFPFIPVYFDSTFQTTGPAIIDLSSLIRKLTLLFEALQHLTLNRLKCSSMNFFPLQKVLESLKVDPTWKLHLFGVEFV